MTAEHSPTSIIRTDVTDVTDVTDPGLPSPSTTRWQPLRLGVVDLFLYDDEQFWFHDGRLLLRGNNGTGKSKVLALTLPFLLDGSILPRRVEPDADPKKRMEWNLLLGGAHPAPERIGYSWVEFGRVESDGTPHFTTLGIGMKAASGRGIVKTWYFVSPRRIGDLHLIDEGGRALTQERLRDQLGGSGQFFTTQQAYRRAVDEALFKLGEERYTALVDLLIQLRQPQLSKRPDEKALSHALTEALAPMGQEVIADVAEAFRSLEEERLAMEEMSETRAAADTFLRHYHGYARIASRQHARRLRQATSAFEQIGRDLRQARDDLTAAESDQEQALQDRQTATERRSALEGARRGLQDSPEARDATRLEDARRSAEDSEARVRRAVAEEDRARGRAADEERIHTAALQEKAETQAQLARVRASAAQFAGEAGLSLQPAQFLDDPNAGERELRRRKEQVTHVRALVRESDRAGDVALRLRTDLDRIEAESASRREDLTEAEAEVEAAAERYAEGVRACVSALVELDLGSGADGATGTGTGTGTSVDVDTLAGAARDWARTIDGEPTVRGIIESAAMPALGALKVEQSRAHDQRSDILTELSDVRHRLDALRSGEDPEPQPSPHRDPAARESRAGAPLWRVTDFAGALGSADRAGLEAALESSGILDAWVLPDGTLQVRGDVVLGGWGPETAPSLAELMECSVAPASPEGPRVQGGVTPPLGEEVVTSVLRRIGVGAGSDAALWVDVDGTWGAGPVRGAWAKDHAEYVGAGARETNRRAAITTLEARAGVLEEDAARLARAIEDLEARALRVDLEQRSYPVGAEREVFSAHDQVRTASAESARAAREEARARAAWQAGADTAREARESLEDQSAQLDLGTSPEDLDRVSDSLGSFQGALAEVRHALELATTRDEQEHQASQRLASALDELSRWESEHRESATRAAGLRALHDQLQESVGASVAELQSRLEAIATDLSRVEQHLDELTGVISDASTRAGTFAEKVTQLEVRREDAASGRGLRTRQLRAFVATGLMRVALAEMEIPADVEEEWSPTSALGVARAVEQQLLDVDDSDEAWLEAQRRVSSESQELMNQMGRHGHEAWIEHRGELMVARVRYHHDDLDIDQLAERLARDVEERERLLTAREREILENFLLDSVAGQLHELISAAETQIDQMNRELAVRKTSTGMQLRVRWSPRSDAPDGMVAARELLNRSDATWTPEDRAAIGDFLQSQIRQAREDDPTAGWQEHLERALDHRRWHSFVIERRQNNQWKSASGPASGGERVLAMSVPLFAAASAHYNSAGSLAPRLILLDEAFAGVDDDSRAKSLGLLATFDLDVVMTSEREWGCYPQVPGLAIAQLSRVEGIDAVGVTRWQWDGRERRRMEDITPPALARASVRPRPVDEPSGTLFG